MRPDCEWSKRAGLQMARFSKGTDIRKLDHLKSGQIAAISSKTVFKKSEFQMFLDFRSPMYQTRPVVKWFGFRPIDHFDSHFIWHSNETFEYQSDFVVVNH